MDTTTLDHIVAKAQLGGLIDGPQLLGGGFWQNAGNSVIRFGTQALGWGKQAVERVAHAVAPALRDVAEKAATRALDHGGKALYTALERGNYKSALGSAFRAAQHSVDRDDLRRQLLSIGKEGLLHARGTV